MGLSVLLPWVGGLFFVGGGIVSLTEGPLWLALAAMVLGVVLLATALFRSVGRWRPTQGRDAEARQAEARLWSTLNNNRR